MLKKIKSILKSSTFTLWLYEFFFQKPIINLYKASYSKKVLFSYSTYHFNKGEYKAHSNYQESHVIKKYFMT